MSPVESTLLRLQDDPTRRAMGPMAWLDARQGEVRQVLQAGRLRDLCEVTGLQRPTVLRWQRKGEKGALPPEVQERGPALVADIAYWRGIAQGLERAIEILAMKGAS